MVYIRQHQSSPLSAVDIENYVTDMGDHRFQDSQSQSSAGPLKYKDKVSVTDDFPPTLELKQKLLHLDVWFIFPVTLLGAS